LAKKKALHLQGDDGDEDDEDGDEDEDEDGSVSVAQREAVLASQRSAALALEADDSPGAVKLRRVGTLRRLTTLDLSR
jgi:hypothetical protein